MSVHIRVRCGYIPFAVWCIWDVTAVSQGVLIFYGYQLDDNGRSSVVLYSLLGFGGAEFINNLISNVV
jgi:hypothetical protein